METIPQPMFVRLDGEVRGPFNPEQLRELAEVRVVTPATEAAETPAGPWARIETRPWGGSVFRRRPEMGFKAAEFVRTNAEAGPVVDQRDWIARANEPPPSGATQRAAERAAATPAEPARKFDAPNEILEMVQGVARREAAAGPVVLPPVKRRGKRRLAHYLVLLVAGNATLAAIPWYYGGPFDVFTNLVIASWFLFYNAGLAYAFFRVLPRY